MSVPFPPGSSGADLSILDWYTVAPSDTEDLPKIPRAIHLSEDGIVALDSFSKDAEADEVFLRGGVWHPMRPSRIYATGTTAGVVIKAGY